VISQSRYINIISGVGAGAAVAQRQLILRLITQNSLLPPGIVMQFSNASSVGAYFGTTSEEYYRALAYFSFISKNVTSPALISFARWVSVSIAPMVVGDSAVKSLTALAAVTAGTLTINDGATAVPIAGLNFSTDLTLSAVAATLQTALRLNADTQLTTCTVTYNTNTNQFVLTGSITGAGNLTITPTGLSTDVSQLLGWGTTGTVYVAGQAASTPTQAISNSAAISNNFGSFAFCTPTTPLANTDITNIAAWNDAQNNMYMYSVATPLANLSALFALVEGFSGAALHLLSTTMPNDYIEQSPCEILAATNYSNANSTQNYMFYRFPKRNITVTDDNTSNTVDADVCNYIGQTQSAGQSLAFYQRGVLCGGATAATDMNTYTNEMWLKSAISAQILTLFLNVGKVPANQDGAAMILSILQSVVTTAKSNGTISVGSLLSATQQLYITQLSNSATAWQQVATLGYWLNITFSSYVNVNNGLTEWQANYTLIYAKDNEIRLVNGSDVMI
jgi:hypothetical protein